MITDQTGHDVLEGVGLNRSATQSQHAPIVYAGTEIHPVIDETDSLTFAVGDNLAPSAEIQVVIYFALGA